MSSKFYQRLRLGIALVAVATAGACGGGGGGGGSSSSSTSSVTPSAAVLNDAPVKGVCYSASPSGLHGVTDAAGTYQYQAGDNVSFWIDVSGAGCGTTPANHTSTTAIALGSVIPGTAAAGTTVQSFVLSLETGPQAAETLQALNHGSASSMDVSGIVLPATQVTNVNTYIAAAGDTTLVSGTPTVDQLFYDAQQNATVASTPLAPTIPIASGSTTFAETVVNNLATTVASGLGPAPTTVTIPANRIVFSTSSGLDTQGAVTTPFARAAILYFDGSGTGTRFVKPASLTTITTANLATAIGNITQPFTYSISGNVVSKDITINNNGSPVGSISDSTTIQYVDDHGAFFSGSSTKTVSATITNSTYTGSNISLTPLTLAMLAGKSVTLEAPDCAGGKAVMTFSADGTTAPSDCGGTQTFADSSVPGILLATSALGVQAGNDGSILLLGLDGATVSAGSAFAVITLNNGDTGSGPDYPAWLRWKILSVN